MRGAGIQHSYSFGAMSDFSADMNASALDREQQVLDAIPTSARAARRFISEALRRHGAPTSLVSDYALVISELATNIIEHGDGTSLIIYLDVADPDWWEVSVVGTSIATPGHWMQPETWAVAGADDASGRGLGIVRHLMDDVATDAAGDRVSIRCRRRRDDS